MLTQKGFPCISAPPATWRQLTFAIAIAAMCFLATRACVGMSLLASRAVWYQLAARAACVCPSALALLVHLALPVSTTASFPFFRHPLQKGLLHLHHMSFPTTLEKMDGVSDAQDTLTGVRMCRRLAPKPMPWSATFINWQNN